MTQLSPTALESAAKAVVEARSKLVNGSGVMLPSDSLYATTAITAYLAQAEKEGWVMVRKPTWTPPFSVGDRVHHISRGEDGTVTSTDKGVLTVEFDNPSPSGGKSIGQFDECWFETHNGWLLAAAQKQGE